MIYEKWGNARFKYRIRSLWCRGYYVGAVGKITN
jgi:putative transposase